MFKFGSSILKTEYIKKEGFKKEIAITTFVSFLFIFTLIVVASLSSGSNKKIAKSYSSIEISSVYGSWEPGNLFMGREIMGKSKSLEIYDKSFILDGISHDIVKIKHETTLPNKAVVFIITVIDEDRDGKEKEYPFILTSTEDAILQLSSTEKNIKLGMSYTR